MTASVRHLRNGAVFLVLICCCAIVGYVIAGWTFGEAAYMAVITVFAVGYEEVNPVITPGLRIFTMLFIMLGCTGYLYIGGALVQFLIEGQIETALGNRRMTKMINKLKEHTIICGYGRVGRMLAAELCEANHPFVVIDQNESLAASINEKGYLFLAADATSEKALVEAGILHANQIAVVLPNDSLNVFITLSARNLNRDLTIIARGMLPSTTAKLKQAGADKVVLAEQIGAERIASLILRPTASSMIANGTLLTHIANDFADLGLQVEELSIPEGSNLAGLTLANLEMKGSSAFLIVAVVKKDGTSIDSPSLDTKLDSGDTLISVCHKGDAPEFTKIFDVKRELQYRGAKLDS
ncbi:MAG: potassium channel protein [Verrucomicrobiales bacterium]|nr:potassium channel protein [Verrucomicrobiales bacterium]